MSKPQNLKVLYYKTNFLANFLAHVFCCSANQRQFFHVSWFPSSVVCHVMARVQQVQLLLIADLHPPVDGGSSSESIIVGASNLSQ